MVRLEVEVPDVMAENLEKISKQVGQSLSQTVLNLLESVLTANLHAADEDWGPDAQPDHESRPPKLPEDRGTFYDPGLFDPA